MYGVQDVSCKLYSLLTVWCTGCIMHGGQAVHCMVSCFTMNGVQAVHHTKYSMYNVWCTTCILYGVRPVQPVFCIVWRACRAFCMYRLYSVHCTLSFMYSHTTLLWTNWTRCSYVYSMYIVNYLMYMCFIIHFTEYIQNIVKFVTKCNCTLVLIQERRPRMAMTDGSLSSIWELNIRVRCPIGSSVFSFRAHITTIRAC